VDLSPKKEKDKEINLKKKRNILKGRISEFQKKQEELKGVPVTIKCLINNKMIDYSRLTKIVLSMSVLCKVTNN
jgi:hypothetical protein